MTQTIIIGILSTISMVIYAALIKSRRKANRLDGHRRRLESQMLLKNAHLDLADAEVDEKNEIIASMKDQMDDYCGRLFTVLEAVPTKVLCEAPEISEAARDYINKVIGDRENAIDTICGLNDIIANQDIQIENLKGAVLDILDDNESKNDAVLELERVKKNHNHEKESLKKARSVLEREIDALCDLVNQPVFRKYKGGRIQEAINLFREYKHLPKPLRRHLTAEQHIDGNLQFPEFIGTSWHFVNDGPASDTFTWTSDNILGGGSGTHEGDHSKSV